MVGDYIGIRRLLHLFFLLWFTHLNNIFIIACFDAAVLIEFIYLFFNVKLTQINQIKGKVRPPKSASRRGVHAVRVRALCAHMCAKTRRTSPSLRKTQVLELEANNNL